MLVKSGTNLKYLRRGGKPFYHWFVFTIVERIMKILRMLKTLITAKGMQVLLLGKEVTMPDGASLGAVIAIKRELSQDKIWMMVGNQGHEMIISIEQIANVTNKVVLSGDSSLANSALNGDQYVF